MTTTYLPTGKTANVARFTMPCEFCPTPVTSERKDGLQAAYRRHLQAHHKDIYQPVKSRGFRDYPAESVQPAQTGKTMRFEEKCPYCEYVASSLREYHLSGVLTRHKRNAHETEFIDEIAARRKAIMNDTQTEELTLALVAQCYYRRASMRTKYPAPVTVLVPVRWGVDRVFVACTAEGKFLAYRGAVGRSETWGVGIWK